MPTTLPTHAAITLTLQEVRLLTRIVQEATRSRAALAESFLCDPDYPSYEGPDHNGNDFIHRLIVEAEILSALETSLLPLDVTTDQFLKWQLAGPLVSDLRP